mmetsp:Transcript_15349/g.43551  ORF Transcript_15349/g.43551 Transcript_15349/m.43551 type:complete len:352 (-) Transcript_15349:792-1847(-)
MRLLGEHECLLVADGVDAPEEGQPARRLHATRHGEDGRRRAQVRELFHGPARTREANDRLGSLADGQSVGAGQDRVALRSLRDGQPLLPGRGVHEDVLLRELDDPPLQSDALRREPADGGLARQHHRVAAVEDCISHVAAFGSGRRRVGHHRLEHLRGHDDGLAEGMSLLNNRLLNEGHPLRAHLDAKIAAGHHDRIDALQLQELDEILGLGNDRLLDLRDQLRHVESCPFRRGFPHHLPADLVHALHVVRRLHERHSDEVDPLPDGKLDVGPVLLGDRRQGHDGVRGVHAFASTQHTTMDDHAVNGAKAVGRIRGESRVRTKHLSRSSPNHLLDDHLDFAVVEVQHLPGP